jgi:hypothetical protein
MWCYMWCWLLRQLSHPFRGNEFPEAGRGVLESIISRGGEDLCGAVRGARYEFPYLDHVDSTAFLFSSREVRDPLIDLHEQTSKMITVTLTYNIKIYLLYKYDVQWCFIIVPVVPPNHLWLDSAPNLGTLISRWEINKFEHCWYKSVKI